MTVAEFTTRPPRAGRCTGERVTLLHGFALKHDGQDVPLPPGAQRLVAFLALHPRLLNRVYVAGMLWTDYSQDAANANLRTALWRLRQLPHPAISSTSTQLSLASGVVVDLREAAVIAQRIGGNGAVPPDEDVDMIMRAGEVLPDWYEDWVVIERERFRQLRLHALEAICDSLTRQHRYGRAIEVGLTAVAEEPLRESAHRAVMRAHLAEGNRAEAQRQYELCRRSLMPLRITPSEETERLHQRCGNGDDVVTAKR